MMGLSFTSLFLLMSERKFTKSPFSADEDRLLTSIVNDCLKQSRSIDWRVVSSQMLNRNARQCKDRWEGYLDTKINREEFSTEENYFILKKVEEVGKKWKVISSMMKRRTDVAVKAQYRKLVRRNITTDNVFFVNTESYQMKQRSPSCEHSDVEPQCARAEGALLEHSSPVQRGQVLDNFAESSYHGFPGNSFPNSSTADSNFESLFSVEDELFDNFEQEIFSWF